MRKANMGALVGAGTLPALYLLSRVVPGGAATLATLAFLSVIFLLLGALGWTIGSLFD